MRYSWTDSEDDQAEALALANEAKQDAWEAEHGPVIYYMVGWDRVGDLGGPNSEEEEAASFMEALEKVRELIAEAVEEATESVEDRTRYRVISQAWAALSAYVQALAELGEHIDVLGPNGRRYWVERHDRRDED